MSRSYNFCIGVPICFILFTFWPAHSPQCEAAARSQRYDFNDAENINVRIFILTEIYRRPNSGKSASGASYTLVAKVQAMGRSVWPALQPLSCRQPSRRCVYRENRQRSSPGTRQHLFQPAVFAHELRAPQPQLAPCFAPVQ